MRSDGSVLGDTQWAWLEEELRGPPTEITIIGSSVQVFCSVLFFIKIQNQFCLLSLTFTAEVFDWNFVSGSILAIYLNLMKPLSDLLHLELLVR